MKAIPIKNKTEVYVTYIADNKFTTNRGRNKKISKQKKIKTNISSAALLNACNVFLRCDSIINETLSAGDAEPLASIATALDTVHLSYEMADGIG